MRSKQLKQVTIGVVITIFLAVVLLSIVRVRMPDHGGEGHENHSHYGAVFQQTSNLQKQ